MRNRNDCESAESTGQFGDRRLLRRSPSLRRHLRIEAAENYQGAVKRAAAEMGPNRDTFPSVCPYSIEQVLDEEFLPS